MLYEFELPWKEPKIFAKAKLVAEDSRNFTRVSRISTIKQVQIGPKLLIPRAVLRVIDAILTSNTWRVSGEFGISLFSVVHHLQDLGKSIQSYRIVLHPIGMKILSLVSHFSRNKTF